MKIGVAKCGMRYAINRCTTSAAYCALTIKCGTRNESGFNKGIVHFAEHTIFKGTKHRKASSINNYLDSLGGELNAYTTKEELVIHTTTLKEDIKKALSLILDLGSCPLFPQKEVEIERGVVIDEINSYKDNPFDDIYDVFEQYYFDNHPLSYNVLGSCDSVSKISSAELLKLASEYFTPDNMAITIIANYEEDFIEDLVLSQIEKAFDVDNNFVSKVGFMPDGQDYYMPKPNIFNKTINKDNHELNFVMGGLAPNLYQDKERITTSLLCNILGGPAANSILNNKLREKNGWVYNVEANYSQYSDCGIYSISLGCDHSNINKCIRVISNTLDKFCKEELSASKLKSAKKQFLGQLAIGQDNFESQCLSMGKSLIAFGDILSNQDIIDRVQSISSSDIQCISNQLFTPSNVSYLIYK